MKKRDVILIAVVLLAALVVFLITKPGSVQGSQIKVTVDGELYGTYSLEQDQEIEVDTAAGHNKIVISGGEAHMEEADCPDGYCIKQGSINKANQTIVCLPHKLVVEVIQSDDDQSVADIIVS